MIRRVIHILLGLTFLSVMAFPLPECYLTKPDCPKRKSGPCSYSGKSGEAGCAAMSCPSKTVKASASTWENDYKPSPKPRSLYSRIWKPFSIRGQEGFQRPSSHLAALQPMLEESGPLFTDVPVFISERHPRAGPLIILHQTFLI